MTKDIESATDEPPSYEKALNPLQHPIVPPALERFFPESSRHIEVIQQRPPQVILIQHVHTDGSKPCLLVCPNCRRQRLTNTDVVSKSTNEVYKLAALLFVAATLICFLVFLNKFNKH